MIPLKSIASKLGVMEIHLLYLLSIHQNQEDPWDPNHTNQESLNRAPSGSRNWLRRHVIGYESDTTSVALGCDVKQLSCMHELGTSKEQFSATPTQKRYGLLPSANDHN